MRAELPRTTPPSHESAALTRPPQIAYYYTAYAGASMAQPTPFARYDTQTAHCGMTPRAASSCSRTTYNGSSPLIPRKTQHARLRSRLPSLSSLAPLLRQTKRCCFSRRAP
ncbi:unnamed protein product [Pieris brassicae]|uniref:Uncharacterized protein n=1 Tax=Pieris brassicae TaxID=7116 RepID=A0A9P0XJS7_PIEBR|nr:unnamed protein product [Pieris brassicae]